MGITDKALDVDLRRPVTLKVITDRNLGDRSAQVRFVREARAAASVRHPNVASVFHLGRTGSSYFYAIEFVEGETLEHLISGRVESAGPFSTQPSGPRRNPRDLGDGTLEFQARARTTCFATDSR